MHNYEQSLYKFKSLKDRFIKAGVIETDLPFLFENKKNRIGILMIHGSEATPCNTSTLGKQLFEKGYTTLGVLLEGHAPTTERLHQGYVSWKDCYKSAIEAFDILKDLVDKIYVLGSSFGGCLAYLIGIERASEVEGVIAVSAPSYSNYIPPQHLNWMKQVTHSIKTVEHNLHHLKVPLLVLHSDDDKVVKVSQAFHAYQKVTSTQKKMIIYTGVGHNLGFAFNNEEILTDINNFITTYKEQRDVKFELYYNEAETVSLAGEFNNWNSKDIPMYFDGEKWLIALKLRPGEYQYKFVIDGKNWILDPRAEKAYAPHGASNSLCIV